MPAGKYEQLPGSLTSGTSSTIALKSLHSISGIQQVWNPRYAERESSTTRIGCDSITATRRLRKQSAIRGR